MKINYPNDYTDYDKSIYDDLISRGRQLIGIKLTEKEAFLLDLSAKITINQMKGYSNNLTDEQIQSLKEDVALNDTKLYHTPADLYVDGYRELENGEKVRHPLDKPEEECYNERIVNPESENVKVEWVTGQEY